MLLKPFGVDPIPSSIIKPILPETKFINKTVILHRSTKQLPPNMICFDVDPEWTRPELK